MAACSFCTGNEWLDKNSQTDRDEFKYSMTYGLEITPSALMQVSSVFTAFWSRANIADENRNNNEIKYLIFNCGPTEEFHL